MKLEIKYPDKTAHQVELAVSMAVLGRDPACDLVINDERCSRRHAVLEVTPTGLQVRDAGSANGVFVNGKKTERSPLVAFDLVRIGEVIIKVLPGDAPTVVMAPEDLLELGTAAGPAPKGAGPTALGIEPPVSTDGQKRAPARAAPAPRSAKPRHGPLSGAEPGGARSLTPRTRSAPPGRPSTVTTLAALWTASILLYGASAAVSPFLELQGGAGTAHAAVSAALALLSAVMAFGLFTRKTWARPAQTVIAGLGLLVCPFTLASATVLIYMLRPATRAAFEGKAGADDPAETTFTLTLIGTVVLGTLLSAAGALSTTWLR